MARKFHTRTGVAVLITGAVIYAAGSVLLAWPYVSRPTTLFIAVPVAAVAGMVVLGALALAVAFLISASAICSLPTSALVVSTAAARG